jgi:geranylgeranyl pyrophosphate synthase
MDLSFNTSFDDYWKATRERLDAEFECSVSRFFDQQPAAHVAAVREVLMGGKRLRGCLVCLLNEALGGTPAAAIPRAMAVECVQAASLIHDDLLDGDTLRRDRAATWTVKGPRRAVLLGDLIFATALQRMAELGRDDALALAEAIANMATGAYQEPLVPTDLEQDRAVDTASLYPQLIYLKTGVLFGTAARLGALAAGASAPLAALAFEYGVRIGEAYQMADDLQDMVGHAAEGASTQAQLTLLAPALWHFCAEARAVLTAENAARLRPQLRKGMLGAIEARLQQARAVVDQLPIGRYRLQLQTAPRDIVRTMWVGAP